MCTALFRLKVLQVRVLAAPMTEVRSLNDWVSVVITGSCERARVLVLLSATSGITLSTSMRRRPYE